VLPRRIHARTGDGVLPRHRLTKPLANGTLTHKHLMANATWHGQPDATSPAQVGRVYPNHPAALRRGCKWGPTPLSSYTPPHEPQEERPQVLNALYKF
jgi:hypothetical protein